MPNVEKPTMIDAENYITERLEQYQSWYDKKSIVMKSRYLRMRAFSVVGGGLVPVLINVKSDLHFYSIPVVQLVVTAISLLVVIAVSLESVFHYREQWKNYRSTEQMLGHEKFLYKTSVGVYSGLSEDDAFKLLVERCEDAISSENAATLNVMTMAHDATESAK